MSYPATTTILETIQLNAQGILRLQEHKHEEAIELFSQGLRSVIKSTLDQAQQQQETSPLDIDGNHETAIQVDTCRQEGELVIGIDLPQYMEDCEYDDDCSFTIYNRALHMSLASSVDDEADAEGCSAAVSTSITDTHCHLLCGILLYNMGLANHHLAMETGFSSTPLKRALDLYSSAHQIIGSIENDNYGSLFPSSDGGVGLTSTNLVLLALANNTGSLHCVLGNRQKVKLCSDEIVDRLTISSIDSTLEVNGDTRSSFSIKQQPETSREYRMYMLNAAYFAAIDRQPAPCA